MISEEEKTVADWGRYPTDYLRVKIVLRALETLKFGGEVSSYKKLWATYRSAMPAAFSDDIDFIVPALLQGKHPKLRNKSVSQVFGFSKDQQKEVGRTVAALEKVTPGTHIEMPTQDIRVLLAALRTAFEKSPAGYATNGYGLAVLRHIEMKVLQPGVRSGETKPSDEQLESKKQSYEQAGAELLKAVFNKK